MADEESGERDVAHWRHNGWDCPWHPFQAIAWFFLFLFVAAHYGFLVFYFPGLWRLWGYLVPAGVFLVHLVSNIVTTSIDPAEPEVRWKLFSGVHQRGTFDRTAHEHVIEDRYCNICKVDVSSSAKHCRICDKCVRGFDHHCKWLNTCIGSRNYRWFMATVSSALTGSILLLLMTLSLFILFFACRDCLRFNCATPTNTTSCDSTLRFFGAPMPDPVFPVLVAVLGVLAMIAVGLVGHLTAFHLFLIAKGLSTYDYIVQRRERERSLGPTSDCIVCKRKVNRVSQAPPSDGSHTAEDVASLPGSAGGGSVGGGSVGMATFGRSPPQSEGSASSQGSSPLIKEENGALRMTTVALWGYSHDRERKDGGDGGKGEANAVDSSAKCDSHSRDVYSTDVLDAGRQNSVHPSPPSPIPISSNSVDTAICMEHSPRRAPLECNVPDRYEAPDSEEVRVTQGAVLSQDRRLSTLSLHRSAPDIEDPSHTIALASKEGSVDRSPAELLLVDNGGGRTASPDLSGGGSCVFEVKRPERVSGIQEESSSDVLVGSFAQTMGPSQEGVNKGDERELGGAVACQSSSNELLQTLKERHQQVQSETKLSLGSLSVRTSPSPTELPSSVPPLQPAGMIQARNSTGELENSLRQVPLDSISLMSSQLYAPDMTDDGSIVTLERSTSPTGKRVSFEKLDTSRQSSLTTLSPRSPRPLPPIGTSIDPRLRELLPPKARDDFSRALGSRPLPPIVGPHDELVASMESLQSGSSTHQFLPSSTHSLPSSTHSLPLPDSRYRQRLGGSSNSLSAQQQERRRRVGGKESNGRPGMLQEDDGFVASGN